jgi:hypothetical protein
VQAVLTHEDVSGRNVYGLEIPDQPVLAAGNPRRQPGHGLGSRGPGVPAIEEYPRAGQVAALRQAGRGPRAVR